MKKYALSVSCNGYKVIASVHNSPDAAIKRMYKLAKKRLMDYYNRGEAFAAYPTSDERYPDAWGYANNGYCIDVCGGNTQYIVEEFTRH